jgi:hypothetical protein
MTALAVIAMSEAKKQSRIYTVFFSGLLRLAPRNDDKTNKGNVILTSLQSASK